MNVCHRLKLTVVAAVAAMLITACGGQTETALTADEAPASADANTQATDTTNTTAASNPAADNRLSDAATSPAQANTAGDVAPFSTKVTLDGDEIVFDMWICFSLSDEVLSASGAPASGTASDMEFVVSYENPAAFDGEDATYDNTVGITEGADTWKAGKSTDTVSGGDWGSLNWTLDGDVLSGTAILEHTWGANPTPPRELTFVTNCS